MRPLLLIQTGNAPDSIRVREGGFADWFRAAMRVDAAHLQVVRVDEGGVLPAPRAVAGAVITGSAAMVTERAGWSERTADWIRKAMDAQKPLFGVCYGHQLMAHALGGEVGWLPAGREIGTQEITLVARDGAFRPGWMEGLPAAFPAQTTHRQAVLAPPPGAIVLARSRLDPHQMLRYSAQAFSTQFHPEFTAGHMRAYIDARAADLEKEGFDPEALRANVCEAEAARALLERFAHHALALPDAVAHATA